MRRLDYIFVEVKLLNKLIFRTKFPEAMSGLKVLLGFFATGGQRLDSAGSTTRLPKNFGGNAVSARNKKTYQGIVINLVQNLCFIDCKIWSKNCRKLFEFRWNTKSK